MQALKSLFEATPFIALFMCVALGYAIGKIRIGQFELGGIPGTLFAAILIGQVGVPVDSNVKSIAFALFIYSLGFVSGPQFFSSLGRSTLNQVYLAIFSSAVVFFTVWTIAQVFGLDRGTAAGLLAGATTESASVGTAGEALANLGLLPEVVKTLQGNVGVTYAVTYLFGFTLVVFFASTIAPWMMRVDLKEAAKACEDELGSPDDHLEPGQEEAMKDVLARVYRVSAKEAVGMTIGEFEKRFEGKVAVHKLLRRGWPIDFTPKTKFAAGDRVAISGKRGGLVSAGEFLGHEIADIRDMGFVAETRDVVITNKKFVGETLRKAARAFDPELKRGVYATKLIRVGHSIELRPGTVLQAGDVVTLYGTPESMEKAAKEVGYTMGRSDKVDYIYLGLGIIAGVLIGKITLHVGSSPISLDTGGGCLVSGLVFGWLRAKRPVFGSLPAATALHLKDFGLSIFIASVGLASGPAAAVILREKGFLLPVLAVVVVLVPLITSMYFARYVLKMNPAVICGALAGLLTCTAGLNAAVAKAESETPVLGYTVPYAIANVLLTLMGPVIVLTT